MATICGSVDTVGADAGYFFDDGQTVVTEHVLTDDVVITDADIVIRTSPSANDVCCVIFADDGSGSPGALLGKTEVCPSSDPDTYNLEFESPITRSSGQKIHYGFRNWNSTLNTYGIGSGGLRGNNGTPGSATVPDPFPLPPSFTDPAGSSRGVPVRINGTIGSSGPEPLRTDATGGVAEFTYNTGIGHQFQRSNFTAAGRDWVFWRTGDAIYVTSSDDDGATWETPVSVRTMAPPWSETEGSAHFDVHFDGTYLHYAASGSIFPVAANSIYYRRGTPNSDGTITWSAAEQVAHTGTGALLELTVNTDSSGVPWISFEDFNIGDPPDNPKPYVTKATAATGSWSTASGFPFLLKDMRAQWWTTVQRLNGSDAMIVFYWNDGPYDDDPTGADFAYCRVWNGSTWLSEITIQADTARLDLDYGGVDTGAAAVANPATGSAYFTWVDTINGYRRFWRANSSFLLSGTGSPSWNTGPSEYLAAAATQALGIDSSNGDVVLAWTDDDDSGNTTALYASRWNGSSWSSAEQLDSAQVFRPNALNITERGSRTVVLAQRVDSPTDVIGYYLLEPSAGGSVVPGALSGAGDVAAPTVQAGASVAVGPLPGSGDVANPAVSAGSPGSVTSPAGTGGGDVANPVISSGATVAAARLTGTGTLPPLSQIMSVLIDMADVRLAGAGDVASPTVTGTGTAGAAPPAATGGGDIANPTISSGAATVEPRATGAGDVANPAVSSGATIGVPKAAGVAAMMKPVVTDGGLVVPRIDLVSIVIIDPAVTTIALDQTTRTVGIDSGTTVSKLDQATTTVIIDG